MDHSSNILQENQTRVTNASEDYRHPLINRLLFGTQASFALIANLVVVFLFTCRRQLLCNTHNRCILSLVITDILASISVLAAPNFFLGEELYKPETHTYIARELYCRVLWNSFLPFAFGISSLYLSVVLSFERWLAVRRSIFYKTRFKSRHMNVLIIISWIAGLTAHIPLATLVKGVYDKPTESCQYTLTQNKVSGIFFSTGLFLIQIVIPFSFITFAYIDTFRGIRASLRFTESAGAENISCIKRLKKVTKVAAITTFLLVVGWLPCSVAFYFSLLTNTVEGHEGPRETFVIFVTLLVFGNCCINPCIDVFANPDLRNAFRDIFRY